MQVIWLELQAWFAGTEVTRQDQWILEERKSVEQVARLVCQYRFEVGAGRGLSSQFSVDSTATNSNSADIFYDAEESLGRAGR